MNLIFSLKTYVLLALLVPNLAFAYVDPGSGSVIVTTILGLIAAIGYTVRKNFYKIKRMIIGKKVEKQAKNQAKQQDDE